MPRRRITQRVPDRRGQPLRSGTRYLQGCERVSSLFEEPQGQGTAAALFSGRVFPHGGLCRHLEGTGLCSSLRISRERAAALLGKWVITLPRTTSSERDVSAIAHEIGLLSWAIALKTPTGWCRPEGPARNSLRDAGQRLCGRTAHAAGSILSGVQDVRQRRDPGCLSLWRLSSCRRCAHGHPGA